MDRVQKEAFVSDLNGRLANMETVVFGHYRGLSVAEMTELRANMREENAEVQVAKNRLAKIALKGTQFEAAADMLVGPSAIAMSEDVVAAAKVAQKFADKNDKFVIVGGCMGDKVLDAAGVKQLASMPSLDELRGKLVGLLQAPATKVATVSAAPATKVARVLSMKDQAAA